MMNDIFSGGSSTNAWIGWNAKTHRWSINDAEASPDKLLVDADSFSEGWIRFNPYDAVFPDGGGASVAQPDDSYQKAWHADVYTDQWLTFRFTSWSVYDAFKSVAPQFKDQPGGKVAELKVTGQVNKDKHGNGRPVFEMVGFVDKPGDSTPAPAAAADDDTVF